MNMKQKLTYMLIGCLFTMVGYTLSTLTNIPTQAQDDNVIDEIICKRLKVVNEDGTPVVKFESFIGNGSMSISHADGEPLVVAGSVDNKSGQLLIYKADGKQLVYIGSTTADTGVMQTYNAAGKELVQIGSIRGRPNDGLINIYNHMGKSRSYTAD